MIFGVPAKDVFFCADGSIFEAGIGYRIVCFVASPLAINAHGEYNSYPAKGVIFA